jgi:glucokinase
MTLARVSGPNDRPDGDSTWLAALGQDALDVAARAVANLAIAFDPQVVAVSGGMLGSAETIIPRLGAALAQLVPFPPLLVLAHFAQQAPLAGACLLAYRAAGLPVPQHLQFNSTGKTLQGQAAPQWMDTTDHEPGRPGENETDPPGA